MSDFILTPAPGSRSTCAFGPFPDATAAEAYARENRLVGPLPPVPAVPGRATRAGVGSRAVDERPVHPPRGLLMMLAILWLATCITLWLIVGRDLATDVIYHSTRKDLP